MDAFFVTTHEKLMNLAAFLLEATAAVGTIFSGRVGYWVILGPISWCLKVHGSPESIVHAKSAFIH